MFPKVVLTVAGEVRAGPAICSMVVAEPALIGYDQDRWVDRLHARVEEADELLALFEPLRQANLALWARTPVGDRDRFGVHAERGPESYGLLFTMIAGHDRFHLAQAERALARAP
ncbi:MAG: hypothetical protein H0W17_08525 [Chloroflexi bacterium]|nr:hypothetical protein [Chloroflexota bacterium]